MRTNESSTYSNAYDAQEARNKALIKAREALKAQGVFYPVKTPEMSTIEFYDAVTAYGIKEASLATKFLKPEPRPVIEFAKPYREWSPFND